MKVIKPIVTVTVYLKESDLFVSMISMELPRTHLEEFAVFTRLSRESISHKSIRSVEGSRPLLSILILKFPLNNVISKLFTAIVKYFVSSSKAKILFEDFGL